MGAMDISVNFMFKFRCEVKFTTFSKSQNIYNYLAAARFTCDYLKISNFDTKNLSPHTVFELETRNLAVVLFNSFLTTCFSRIFELGPQF